MSNLTSSFSEPQRYDEEDVKRESFATQDYSNNGTNGDLENEEDGEEEVEEINESGQDVPDAEQMGETDAFSNVARGLDGHNRDLLMQYWQNTINSIEHDDFKFKIHHLPLARIKKVMKADQDVKMISAEAPILFAKGCDIFITELTMRAWIHAEDNKRRTLQRSDIANALQKSDMFDFLIDIVPREEAITKQRSGHGTTVAEQAAAAAAAYTKDFADGRSETGSTGEPSETRYPSDQASYGSEAHGENDEMKHNSQRGSENRHGTEQGYNEVYHSGYGDWDGYKQY